MSSNYSVLADFKSFLAFSKVTGIETVHMFGNLTSTHNAPRQPIEDPQTMRNVIGISYDFKTERYFFSDIQRGNIQSVYFNGTYAGQIVDSKYASSINRVPKGKENL